ncbi:AAA family ATPase [Rhodococcus aetherivorans]|uniref:AAA family ATPase n=1 Tax=Rhodococcus aetherivorans TaxID=191292 RepID=UPI00045CC5F2|nr:AAA family ATPase [Rhodococcus aetherivorans]KDE13854.1 hypothetical protein N505_0108485 [Rhodococcus aetherivorans]
MTTFTDPFAATPPRDGGPGASSSIFPFRGLTARKPYVYVSEPFQRANAAKDNPAAWSDEDVEILASSFLELTPKQRAGYRAANPKRAAVEELRRRLTARHGAQRAEEAIRTHEDAAYAAVGKQKADADAQDEVTANGQTDDYRRKVQAELVKLRARRDAQETLRQEEADASGVRPIREMLFTAEQFATMDAPDPLVEGVLDAGALAEMVGTRASAKTFVALDMALSIATGTTWAGHATTRGRVLYLVGEGGGRAFGIRLEAWGRKHGVSLAELQEWFAGMDGAVPFMSSRWHELVEFAVEWRPSLVVVDTLGRHSTGMEENSNSDVHRAVELVKVMQDRAGAAVLLLHHPAKGGSAIKVESGRGAGAWEGAADAVFGLNRDGDERTPLTDTSVEMVCTKQKHRPDGQTWTFTFEAVEVTPNGTWSSSLVPILTDPLSVPSAQAAQAVADAKAAAVDEWIVDAVEAEPGNPATSYYRTGGVRRVVSVQGREVSFSINEAKAAVDRLVGSGRLVRDVVNAQRKLLRLPDEDHSAAPEVTP